MQHLSSTPALADAMMEVTLAREHEPTAKATRGEEGGSPEEEGVRAAAGTWAEATG